MIWSIIYSAIIFILLLSFFTLLTHAYQPIKNILIIQLCYKAFKFRQHGSQLSCCKNCLWQHHLKQRNNKENVSVLLFMHWLSFLSDLYRLWQAACSNIQPRVYFIIQLTFQPSTMNIQPWNSRFNPKNSTFNHQIQHSTMKFNIQPKKI